MEVVEEDIVIVGAGIAGLTTALGLHRLGIRSLVLESSQSLRATGFAFTTWTNAWRAMDAIGIGDSLRRQHKLLNGIVAASTISGLSTSEMSFKSKGSFGEHEVRCLRRKLLLEALEKELPIGTIKYSSKVVSIEESGCFKLLHVADGSVLRTKVLIGCDGVNSAVAKWLGFNKAAFVGRSAIRGHAVFKGSHGFGPTFLQFSGNDKEEVEENPAKMKEFVLSKLGKVPDQVRAVVEITELDDIICSPLRFRHPWDLLWGNISKGSVCVAGDAFHPMTPDIGQVREAKKDEYKRIEMGLKKFARERRWRGFELISTAYMVGFMQQSDGVVMNFLRDKIFAAFLAGLLLKRADFDCGKLCIS
ncbi:FAD/NAD(P)-binding oxidoreductase family protein [Actinidia rufa]|uniref:FAD/NAD(P)-binding oxidoreductase family protein n=1 Tax=Actinidia rufa TaxID=165716 RepID=A0A7J0FP82_9ERIC|nr:FAD/NAD(P)-binding oxidoreductase family protein [Actinidia rufa]